MKANIEGSAFRRTLLIQSFGNLKTVNTVNPGEVPCGLAGLVGLEGADEMPSYVVTRKRRLLRQSFLQITFPEVALPSAISRQNGGGGLRLADSHQSDRTGASAVSLFRGRDTFTEYRKIFFDGLRVNIVVWRNPELSTTVPVRPDGKITTPLVEDLPASGKSPTQLARDIESALAKYIQSPVVTVIVAGFVGPYSEQIRIVGQAAKPQALPYRENMTLLDLMISVGGITDFAAGNKASILRRSEGKTVQFGVRLIDLLRYGDISANVPMRPGDILLIPQSFF